jgi:hypothetical protein
LALLSGLRRAVNEASDTTGKNVEKKFSGEVSIA